mmetsp:Transcript_15546/g.37856  ORF Transcript_15546/g.37856 Transcript_15546/m.37856 type:complete len:214 (-) Transcript_15546:585-1226(-)
MSPSFTLNSVSAVASYSYSALANLLEAAAGGGSAGAAAAGLGAGAAPKASSKLPPELVAAGLSKLCLGDTAGDDPKEPALSAPVCAGVEDLKDPVREGATDCIVLTDASKRARSSAASRAPCLKRFSSEHCSSLSSSPDPCEKKVCCALMMAKSWSVNSVPLCWSATRSLVDRRSFIVWYFSDAADSFCCVSLICSASLSFFGFSSSARYFVL